MGLGTGWNPVIQTAGVSPDLQTGTLLANYRIESVCGRGGMGVVYLAQDVRLERRVAVKVPPADLASDEGFRQRFTRESRMAAAIDHPNIIPVYDAGESEGTLYIAMRYVDGLDLRDALIQGGPIPADRAVKILRQVAWALDAAHTRGLVHRDVKPGNIMMASGEGVEAEDHVYLTDFGLTKRTSAETHLTAVGQFVGTIDYVAPEQIEGRDVDGRTDQYSLACVLHECLTGAVPFRRDSDVGVLFAHMSDPPPKLSAVRPDLPSGLDDVLAKAMAKSKEDRYQTCGEFVGAVRAVLDGTGSRTADAATPDAPEAPPAARPAVPATPAMPPPPYEPVAISPSPPAEASPLPSAPARPPTPAPPQRQPPVRPERPPRRRRGLLFGGAAIVVAAVVAAALILRSSGGQEEPGGAGSGSGAGGSGVDCSGIPTSGPSGPPAAGAQLFVMNADGSNVTRLTHDAADDGGPSFSPDCRQIAFGSVRAGQSDIFLMNTDGTQVHPLTNGPADDGGQEISPNGKRIVFTSTRDGQRELYLMNFDGSNKTRLTDNPAGDLFPTWSPDGTKIVFCSNRQDANFEIYTIKPDRSGLNRLTFTAGENEKDPTMSPDGRFVAYTSNPGANRDVFLLDVNTGDVTRLTNAPGGDETPSWSPDGTKIVFSSERAGGTPHIFVMNADGSGVKQLTSGLKADSMPKFSPDGEHIAFARGPA